MFAQVAESGPCSDFSTVVAKVFLKEAGVAHHLCNGRPLPDALAHAGQMYQASTRGARPTQGVQGAGRAGQSYGFNEFQKSEFRRLKGESNVCMPRPGGCSAAQGYINSQWQALPRDAQAYWNTMASRKHDESKNVAAQDHTSVELAQAPWL